MVDDEDDKTALDEGRTGLDEGATGVLDADDTITLDEGTTWLEEDEITALDEETTRLEDEGTCVLEEELAGALDDIIALELMTVLERTVELFGFPSQSPNSGLQLPTPHHADGGSGPPLAFPPQYPYLEQHDPALYP
jgi:hypothetical protein